MDWKLLGYQEYPFSIHPISFNTLPLFTGHDTEIEVCKNLLDDNNIRLVIEGARGVGTTSFANFLKFYAQKKQLYFSPRDEVSVEKNWNLESLLTAVISTIIRELEITHNKEIKKNTTFIEAKALSYRLSEAYNTFGVSAFSFGGSYGKSGTTTQPTFIPSTTLMHHLQDLGKLAIKLGYKNGILIQLNNLDVNVFHTEEHLEYLFNAARDSFQSRNISWFFVGDIGLRAFIARRVDRLDDIISDEVLINPPSKAVYHELINKRLNHYRTDKHIKFPLNNETMDYLYDITHGRLRYIFGIIYAITNRLNLGKIIQTVSTELAKTAISALVKERMQKFILSKGEENLIETLVKLEKSNIAALAKITRKNRTLISRTMNKLLNEGVVTVRQEGNQRIYEPSIDAKIAFSTPEK